MKVDGSFISSLLVIVFAVLSALYTKIQASSKSQRAELRHRRLLGLEVGRYCYDLEQKLSNTGQDLPVKRQELLDAEAEDW
jgi:hypothetical protein